MSPAFFPFPYPVTTPLGEGYAIYVTAAPMYENDSWCVQLDDGRILHFSTNQLRGVTNGTYEIQPPKPAAPLYAPGFPKIARDGSGAEYVDNGPGVAPHRSDPREKPTPPSNLAAAVRRMAAKRR